MGYRVVIVGATGNVGREMLNILSERQFPIDKIAALKDSPQGNNPLNIPKKRLPNGLEV